MVMGAPLEDARHLAQCYDRMRQEAEAQAVEVSKRQAKVREGGGNPYMIVKLEAAESKLQDFKSNMAILGREVASTMAAVETQQQEMTLQSYQRVITVEESFGGNTRDLGSIGEETDKTTTLHHSPLEEIRTESGDGVAAIKRRRHELHKDGVRDLATASAPDGNLRELSGEEAWEAIETSPKAKKNGTTHQTLFLNKN
ncbi:hypothetical protein Tco_0359789 [Tanacetum coccineum]